jgi:membrane protease YdiL (CAAX protease family)
MNSNKSNDFQANSHLKTRVNPKLGFVFIVLIILFSSLVPLIGLASGPDYNKYTNLYYFYVISSYTIIVLSIIIFRSSDLEVFQDHFSLWTIVLSCFLRASLGGENEALYKGILIFIGTVLSIYIIRNRKNIKMPNVKSIFISIVWSVGTVVLVAMVIAFLVHEHGSLPSDLLSYIIKMSVFQFSFVTVIEESCFRGLLFCFLVMNGYKENKALFLQAVLFWGVHYMKMNNPVLFFVASPILILSITLIIKKYKMLYSSIIMHTLNNVFTAVLVALF